MSTLCPYYSKDGCIAGETLCGAPEMFITCLRYRGTVCPFYLAHTDHCSVKVCENYDNENCNGLHRDFMACVLFKGQHAPPLTVAVSLDQLKLLEQLVTDKECEKAICMLREIIDGHTKD